MSSLNGRQVMKLFMILLCVLIYYERQESVTLKRCAGERSEPIPRNANIKLITGRPTRVRLSAKSVSPLWLKNGQ